jgi:hypothetical protein
LTSWLQYRSNDYSVAVANTEARHGRNSGVSVLVRIEHPIADYARWKAAFDRDPIDRAGSGVRRYRIFRPVDDPNAVAIDLEFDDRVQAESARAALVRMWQSPQAVAAMGMTASPRAEVIEVVDSGAY